MVTASDCETFAPFTIEFVVPQSWSVTGEPGEMTSVDDAAFTDEVGNVHVVDDAVPVLPTTSWAPKPLPVVEAVTSTEFGPLSTTVAKSAAIPVEVTLLPVYSKFKLLSITGPALFAVKVMEPIC